MKWFKHDSDANMDDRLQEVLLDYGLEGYGLYWYCLELITSKINGDNITFELKHDSRIIARNTGCSVQKVEEMMKFLIRLGLFENTEGKITCLKLAKRLDKSMTTNPRMRDFIDSLRASNVMLQTGDVMTKSEIVMTQSENVSLEGEEEGEEEGEGEGDNKTLSSKPSASTCPHLKIIELYHEILPELPRVIPDMWKGARAKALAARWKESDKHQSLEFWKWYFNLVRKSQWHLGVNERGWQANLEWLVKQRNFVNMIEKNRG